MPSGGNSRSDEIDSAVWIIPLIDNIAHEYGWSLREIYKTPMLALLQLNQRIMKRNDPTGYAMRNPILQQARAREMKGMTHG